jgi:hypothetical protein
MNKMVEKSKGFDAKKLIKNIAADINKLDSTIAKKGKIDDLKKIDFSPLYKGSTAKAMKKTREQLVKIADETSEENRNKVEEISTQVEDSLKKRQEKLESGLKELSKSDVKDNTEVKMIISRISEDIEINNRRINEFQIAKTLKARTTGIVPNELEGS